MQARIGGYFCRYEPFCHIRNIATRYATKANRYASMLCNNNAFTALACPCSDANAATFATHGIVSRLYSTKANAPAVDIVAVGSAHNTARVLCIVSFADSPANVATEYAHPKPMSSNPNGAKHGETNRPTSASMLCCTDTACKCQSNACNTHNATDPTNTVVPARVKKFNADVRHCFTTHCTLGRRYGGNSNKNKLSATIVLRLRVTSFGIDAAHIAASIHARYSSSVIVALPSKNVAEKKLITVNFAEHGTKGARHAVAQRCLSSFNVRVDNTAGTLQPQPTVRHTRLCPHSPNGRKNLSVAKATRARYPDSSNKVMHADSKTICGKNATTENIPVNAPSHTSEINSGSPVCDRKFATAFVAAGASKSLIAPDSNPPTPCRHNRKIAHITAQNNGKASQRLSNIPSI